MAIFPTIELSACPLCDAPGPLCYSHIIPRFVYRWKIETSSTGRMRSGLTPNVRVQDGPTAKLLCGGCEERLNGWETPVANALFYPYHADSSVEVHYGPWLAKFCASVVWRVLASYRYTGEWQHFSAAQRALADQALSRWRDFMFGQAPDPDAFELHLLPVEVMADARGVDLPPNMTRYLARAVDMDLPCTDDSAFVFAKMCRLAVIGFIQMRHPQRWVGTRVEVTEGVIKPRAYQLPIGDYLASRARIVARLQGAISERQQQRVDHDMRADPDRVAMSDDFRALRHDVEMFGEEKAFERPKDAK